MEWQQLKYFQCVASTEHIGKASEMLHVTQPAISMSIKKLEDEIGVPLFERQKKNIKLNKYGRIFLKHVNNATNEIEQGMNSIKRIHNTDINRVTVMIPANLLSAPVMERLYNEIPNLMLENRNIDYASTEDDLKTGKLDICILSPPISLPDFVTIPIEMQHMCIITSNNSELASVEECHLADLAGEAFISYSEGSAPRINFEEICRAKGFVPNISFECNSIRTLVGPITTGRGISLVSEAAFDYYDMQNMHVIKLLDDDVYTILSLCYYKDAVNKPLVKKVIDILSELYPQIDI